MNMAVFPLLEAINFGVTMVTPSAAPRPRDPHAGFRCIDAGPDIGPLQGELNRVLFLALPFLTLLFLAGDGVRREFFLRAIGSPH